MAAFRGLRYVPPSTLRPGNYRFVLTRIAVRQESLTSAKSPIPSERSPSRPRADAGRMLGVSDAIVMAITGSALNSKVPHVSFRSRRVGLVHVNLCGHGGDCWRPPAGDRLHST